MCLSLYALLLGMLVIDLHAINKNNICKSIQKVWKTVPSVRFIKSKARNPRKINEVQRNSNLICKS